MSACGRRSGGASRNYFWILLIQTVAYLGKLMVHPTSVTSFAELLDRAAIGPIPGWFVLLAGGTYCASWGLIAIASARLDAARARKRHDPLGMG